MKARKTGRRVDKEERGQFKRQGDMEVDRQVDR